MPGVRILTRVAIGDACPGGGVQRRLGHLTLMRTLSYTCAVHGRIPFVERIVGGDRHVGTHFAAILSVAFTCHTCAHGHAGDRLARPPWRGYAGASLAKEKNSPPKFFARSSRTISLFQQREETPFARPELAISDCVGRTNFAEHRYLRRAVSTVSSTEVITVESAKILASKNAFIIARDKTP